MRVSDGLEEIFVNTNIDDGSAVADLMRCFLQSNVSNPKFPALSRKMNGIKNTKEGMHSMSAVIDKYYGEEIQEVRKEAHAEGVDSFAHLCQVVAAKEGQEAMNRVINDPDFREEMFAKYNL